MECSDRIVNQEKKIKNLEMELNDLRQGLTTVEDIYCELIVVAPDPGTSLHIEQVTAKPQNNDDREFDGFWRFHEDILVPEPSAYVSCVELYEAFRKYCIKTGRELLDQTAFEYVFARLKYPHPMLDKGAWKGYRVKDR
jgi:hypothetical protein